MRRPLFAPFLGTTLLLCACQCQPAVGSGDAGEVEDAGIDAGPGDAGSGDAGPGDAGAPDSGTPDSGTPDSGLTSFDGGRLFDVMAAIPNLPSPLSMKADFNNDGHLDAVSIQSSRLVVALATGPGTYAVTYDAGFNTSDITFFDVDTDGTLDMVVKDTAQPGWTAFHRGDGQGHFVFQGRWYRASSLLDVTGDGVPESVEIVSTTSSPGAIYVNRTLADGGVDPTYTSHSLGTGWGLIADFNHDHIPDYVSVGDYLASTRQFQVFMGQADGGIVGAPSTVTCTNCNSGLVALGDMNADGRPDVVALTTTAVTVWTVSATGVLTPGPTIARSGARILVAYIVDMDGDGSSDIVAQEDGLSLAYGVRIYFSRATGLEASDDYLYTEQGTIQGVTDINYDGRPDLVLLDNQYAEGRTGAEVLRLPARSASQSSPGGWGWFDMNGDGLRDGVSWLEFQDKMSIATLGPRRRFETPTQCSVASRLGNESRFMRDLDGDGHPDQYSFTSTGLDVSLGHGGCNFDVRTTWLSSPSYGEWFDVNGDRKLDLALSTGQLQLQVDAGVFAPAVTSGIPANATYRATDWSGDGLIDVIVLNTGSTQISFGKGDGAGHFAFGAPQNLPPGEVMDFATVDVDSDGDLDVLVSSSDTANNHSRIDLWRQTSPGTFALEPSFLSSGCSYWTNLFTADLDMDGTPEAIASCQNMSEIWSVGATARARTLTSASRAGGGPPRGPASVAASLLPPSLEAEVA